MRSGSILLVLKKGFPRHFRERIIYFVVIEEFRAEDNVVSVVRLGVGEEMGGYGGDIGGGNRGELAFAGGGVDFAFVADAGQV